MQLRAHAPGGVGQLPQLVTAIGHDGFGQIALGHPFDPAHDGENPPRQVAGGNQRQPDADQQHQSAHQQRGIAGGAQAGDIAAAVHGDLDHPDGRAGIVLNRRRIDRQRLAQGRHMAHLRLALRGLEQSGLRAERLGAHGGAEGGECVVRDQIEGQIDPLAGLELLEEALIERQPELHRSGMPAGMVHGNHPADSQSGDAALQAADRGLGLVGVHHGAAERREVIAEFLRLVQAQEGGGGRGMELELLDAEALGRGLVGRQQQGAEAGPVAGGEFLLDRRQRGDEGGQRLGHAALSGDGLGNGLDVVGQFAGFGLIDQRGHGLEIGRGQGQDHDDHR